jgi:hypothetical protein
MPITPQDAVILRQAVERQLTDLDTQRAELQDVLQRLNGSPRKAKSPAAEAPKKKGRRRRAKMTAAQRKAVSERMRKYWAAKKKSK